MKAILFLAFCVFALVVAQDDADSCGYNRQFNHTVEFDNTHVCSFLNGQPGDKFFWENGWGDESDELQDIADFVSNQTKVYTDRLTALGTNAPTCPQCAAWYNRYLCLASTPAAGASSCVYNAYWEGLRATNSCATECSSATTGLPANCDPKTQCCWCLTDNATSAQCNNTLDNYLPSDSMLNKCLGVTVDYCQKTFAVCLNLPQNDVNIVNACSFFAGNVNTFNTAPQFPNTTGCSNDFSTMFVVSRLNGTGLPVLLPKNCTPVRVTTANRRVCNGKIFRTCKVRTVNVKPYYVCQANASSLLSFATSFLVAVVSFALFL
eukprot:TRINITY_DN2908_c0_g1_i1.p1 TRINITY_DN2908_c0_g1~~TRINITY_DN2908_c0_g1_i1.p1  ORF type:complete len:335 (-),score=112.27 TRINITY_DN2908_c0_g1_i1:79-1041(-)